MTAFVERAGIRGSVFWDLFDEYGILKYHGEDHNLITQIGDEYYGERAAGIGSPPGQVTGMKLGTGSTAVAKTGAGSALVTYLSNSHQAIDGTYPQSSLNGSSRRIQWRSTFAAGKATTASAITEAVLVIDALADATSTDANTISRVIVSGVPSKAAGDSLVLTWNHDLLGA